RQSDPLRSHRRGPRGAGRAVGDGAANPDADLKSRSGPPARARQLRGLRNQKHQLPDPALSGAACHAAADCESACPSKEGSLRMRRAILVVLIGSVVSTPVVEPAHAQSPAPPANLNQLMRGTFYPAANVVFAAQDVNPADVPRAKDPNMAT